VSLKRNDIVRYRLSRARESLEEARLLANMEHWNASVNRLYYACFYAVSSLLIQHNLSSSKHTGVRALFNLHFVKPGKISHSIARTYHDLFERRQEGDYGDYATFSPVDVNAWITEADLFVTALTEFIDKYSD